MYIKISKRSNSLTWNPEGKKWQIQLDEGKTYLHPSVTMNGIQDAIADLVLRYGEEDLTIYIMEKICRRKPNEDDVLIHCNPQHSTATRFVSRQIRQVYSTVVMRWREEDGTEEPWVCRVFGILAVSTPDGLAIRLIVAYMEPVAAKTFLPYPVYKHYTQPNRGVVLYSADSDDILDVAFMVPLLNGAGFDFNHIETLNDFEDIPKIQERLYHCILPDRFAYPAQAGVEFFSNLACDDADTHKPRGVSKTFVPITVLKDFEKRHYLDQPRKVTGNESESEDEGESESEDEGESESEDEDESESEDEGDEFTDDDL